MENYLTISEFAGLRGININSLRYYERLGLLRPAQTDPKTGYRRYLPEQLHLLDTILLCIRLDIPLKNMQTFLDAEGNLDGRALLESGKQRMHEKITAMQRSLELVEFDLCRMEQNRDYHLHRGVYRREIEERHLVTVPFRGNWNDVMQKESSAMDVFRTVQALDMSPVFPAGILVHCDQSPLCFSFFVQVLHPRACGLEVLQIPRGDFLCFQADITSHTDIPALLHGTFNLETQTVKNALVAPALLDRTGLDARRVELQIPCDDHIGSGPGSQADSE